MIEASLHIVSQSTVCSESHQTTVLDTIFSNLIACCRWRERDAIPPGTLHQLRNAGPVALKFLCCAPAYEDTVLEETT